MNNEVTTIELLNNDTIYNFVYSNNTINLLIGKRQSGKTTALVLSAFKEAYIEGKDVIYLICYTSCRIYISELFLQFCKEYHIPKENITKTLLGNGIERIKLTTGSLTIMSADTFKTKMREDNSIMNFNSICLDESEFMFSLKKILAYIRQNIRLYNSHVFIAGSMRKEDSDTIKTLINGDYSYQLYLLDDYFNTSSNEFKDIIDDRNIVFRSPIEQLTTTIETPTIPNGYSNDPNLFNLISDVEEWRSRYTLSMNII